VLGAVGEQLGVPLDAEAEAQLRVVDRLERAVGRVGGRDEPRPELVDGLVVEAVDLEPAPPGQAVQRRAFADGDRVRGLVGLVLLAVLEPGAVR
jgi:hypothetical protein